MDTFSLVFHTALLAHHLFAAGYNEFFIDTTKSNNVELQNLDKFKLRFLTMWNMIVQVIYLMFAIYADVRVHFSKNNKIRDQLNSIKGFFYTTAIFPFGLFVCGSFWTLFTIDRELVFPEIYDEFFPPWMNHCIHSNIILLPAVGLFSNKAIPNWKSALIFATGYFWLYQMTLFYTYFESSFWLYKVFAVLGWPTRISYVFFNYLMTIVLLYTGIYLQKQINRGKFQINSFNTNVFKKLA